MEKMDEKEEEEFLANFVKSTGKSKEVLTDLLRAAEAEAKEQGLEGNTQAIKGIFGSKLRGQIFLEKTGKRTQNEPITIRGFLLGASGLRDTLDWYKREAMRQYRENPDNAKLEGYVDENANPLDWRETIKQRGKEVANPNYHKPMIGHNMVRDVFGIGTKGNETEPKLFVFSVWKKFATEFNYRPFTAIEMRARIKQETPYYLSVNPVIQKGVSTIKASPMNIDYYDWIRKACASRVYTLAELDKAIANTEHANDPWILLEGTVDKINLEVNDRTNKRSLIVIDLESGSTDSYWVNVPKDFPIAFREYSKVLIFGTPRKWKRADEEEFQYSINAFSMYPIPGETVESKIVLTGKGSGEQEEDGWNLFGE